MKLTVFRIPDLPAHLRTRDTELHLSAEHAVPLLKLLQLPALPHFTLEPDQLPGLCSIIADNVDHGGELDVMQQDHRYHKAKTAGIASYLVLNMRELSRVARLGREHNLALEWVTC